MAEKRKLQFKTETQKLLQLVIHSLYSNTEIFLRELVSNASDALDKLRFLMLSDKDLAQESNEFWIELKTDAKKKTLTILDNGVGMSEQDLIENLGTIARSGTGSFIETLKDAKDAPSLIGQFGVGFYSAFMVAKTVKVISKKAGTDQAFSWESDGEGSFTVNPAKKETRGTEIILSLKDDCHEYLEEYRLRSLIKKYSDFIEYPIKMEVEKNLPVEGEKDKFEKKLVSETLNSQKAIWMKRSSELSDEEYDEFYKHLSHDYEKPFERIHFAAEGVTEFNALLYLPAKMPFDLLMQGDRMRGVQLFVKRVFIMDDAEALMPRWLRFVKGVVDSADLPLNVSREILQQDRVLTRIKSNLVKKIIDSLKERLENDRPAYSEFFKQLGSIIKEGVALDYENREKIMDLLLFESTATKPGEYTSLKDYLNAMPAEQKEILILSGDNRAELEKSPYLEAARAKNYEVLFFTDPVDEWLLPNMPQYQEKPFKSLTKGEFSPEDEEGKKAKESQEKELKGLIEWLTDRFSEKLKEVRVSSRLVSSPSCLIADEHDLGAHMEQLMRSMRQEVPKSKRILEINPGHEVVRRLNQVVAEDAKSELAGKLAEALYANAVISEGGKLDDPVGFSEFFSELLLKYAQD